MATRYVVLLQDPEDETEFVFRDIVEADHGPEQAVRRYTEELSRRARTQSDANGDVDLYIAVPVSNWNVVPRRVTIPAPRIEVAKLDADVWLAGLPTNVMSAEPVEWPVPDPDPEEDTE